MKRISLVFGMVAALSSGTALAQHVRLGIDATGTIPVGNFSNTYGVGLGGLLRLEVLPLPGFAVTGRAGYIQHFTHSIAGVGGNADATLGELPILAGAKFYTDSGLYGALEVGGTYINPTFSGSLMGISTSSSSFNPSAAVGVGLVVGPLDLRGGLHAVDLGHIGDTLEIGLSAGFNFFGL